MEDEEQWDDIDLENSWACGVRGADGFRHCVRFSELKAWSAKQDQLRAAGVKPMTLEQRLKELWDANGKFRKTMEAHGISFAEAPEE